MSRLRAAARVWAALWPGLHLVLWVLMLPEVVARSLRPLPGTESDGPLVLALFAASGALGGLAAWAAVTSRRTGRLVCAALVPLAVALALAPRGGWPGPVGEALFFLQGGAMIVALPLTPLVERPEPWLHGLYALALAVLAAVPPPRA